MEKFQALGGTLYTQTAGFKIVQASGQVIGLEVIKKYGKSIC
ncbi:hypothetical protein SAMN05216431_12020 [Ligilactobacillus sp. WC1T17]|uniref:Uncharacterized protein n=1 Tax=Ligilactobacillus ruminis TaxID=1623 RepID=A0ABY1AEW9_9LACO|nr:hypothetical protein SAMN05216431_12020 [Ligilactobacillus ruminis]